MQPETRYARSGDVHIAYQVTGEGPFDLVWVPGFVSNVELAWEDPELARFAERLASFSRLIMFDKRGTGLSDPVSGAPSLEERMDDVRAVMDAAGSERAALFGVSEGGPLCTLFSATHPERVTALVLYGTTPRFIQDVDFPWGATPDQFALVIDDVERNWGKGAMLDLFAPSRATDEQFRTWWGRFQRRAASPGMVRSVLQLLTEIDVRAVLPTINVPTLVLHRADEIAVPAGAARYMAEHIPGARHVALSGADHMPHLGDSAALLDEIEEFLTGSRQTQDVDRVLSTVLFTDIVDATARAAELGDRAWSDQLQQHHAVVRRELVRSGGHEVDTAGDGFFATFDGPARGIRCAGAIQDALAATLRMQVRAGLHTGECEVMGDKVGGIAVHIGARVAAQAGPGEVLVSSTVKDLVAGSGLRFLDRGVHVLKGVPGEWRLFGVVR